MLPIILIIYTCTELDSLDSAVDVHFIVSKLYWYTVALYCHGDDVCVGVDHSEAGWSPTIGKAQLRREREMVIIIQCFKLHSNVLWASISFIIYNNSFV